MNFSTAHVINLREEPEKFAATAENFREHGVNPQRFIGVNGPKWGLETHHIYRYDHPDSGYKIADNGYTLDSKCIGLILSHYWLWRSIESSNFVPTTNDCSLIAEDDCRLQHNWTEIMGGINKHLPDDWDILFPGSCCTQDKNPVHISGPVWKVRPFCTHCYIVRRRALPIMIGTQEKAWAKLDIALFLETYPLLNTYAILPSIALQEGTPLHP